MGIAAPVVEAEMADWVRLGGGNSGIVGDAAHSFGFHIAADELPASDYSRTRDPNGSDGPYVNWDYACAGDFSHRYDERLRAMHRDVLARLMRGELPMICEFIGKPWADQPVYYWARWNGDSTLQRYTGSGHDHWSHISWYRSRVDQRAYLWTGDDMTPEEHDNLVATDRRVWEAVIRGSDSYNDLSQGTTRPWIVTAVKDLQAKVGKPAPVDVNALAAALASNQAFIAAVAAGVAAALPKPPTPDQIADELHTRLAG